MTTLETIILVSMVWLTFVVLMKPKKKKVKSTWTLVSAEEHHGTFVVQVELANRNIEQIIFDLTDGAILSQKGDTGDLIQRGTFDVALQAYYEKYGTWGGAMTEPKTKTNK